jgi:hypothetical protein
MQVRAAIPALVRDLDSVGDLDLRGAIVAARDQVEARFDAPSGPLHPWRRFRFSLAVILLVTALTVLSIHVSP